MLAVGCWLLAVSFLSKITTFQFMLLLYIPQ